MKKEEQISIQSLEDICQMLVQSASYSKWISAWNLKKTIWNV